MIFLIGLLFAFFFLLLFLKLAPHFGLIDTPDNRKNHSGNVPLIGGPIIFLTLITIDFLFEIFPKNLSLITYLSIPLFLITVLDDIKPRHWSIRLIFQLLLSISIIGITDIQVLSLGQLGWISDVQLGVLAPIFTILCIVGLTNAINMFDGIDGLAGTYLLTGFFSFILLSDGLNSYTETVIIFLLLISFFLALNLSKSSFKIFLGDSGSMSIGFIFGWLLIIFSQSKELNFRPELVIWIASLPIIDSLRVMFERYKNKMSVFHPDNRHFHHLLINNGFSKNKTLVFLASFNLMFLVIGLVIDTLNIYHYSYFIFLIIVFLYFRLIRFLKQ